MTAGGFFCAYLILSSCAQSLYMDVVLKSNETEQKALLHKDGDGQIPDEKTLQCSCCKPHKHGLYTVYDTSIWTLVVLEGIFIHTPTILCLCKLIWS